jgi:hypothetical protein
MVVVWLLAIASKARRNATGSFAAVIQRENMRARSTRRRGGVNRLAKGQADGFGAV